MSELTGCGTNMGGGGGGKTLCLNVNELLTICSHLASLKAQKAAFVLRYQYNRNKQEVTGVEYRDFYRLRQTITTSNAATNTAFMAYPYAAAGRIRSSPVGRLGRKQAPLGIFRGAASLGEPVGGIPVGYFCVSTST